MVHAMCESPVFIDEHVLELSREDIDTNSNNQPIVTAARDDVHGCCIIGFDRCRTVAGKGLKRQGNGYASASMP